MTRDVDSAEKELVALFERTGHVRRQKADRLGSPGYKKGEEIRIGATSENDLAHIRELLIECGFRPGKAHKHGESRYRQPVYGRQQTARFLEMVERVRQDR